MRTTLNIDDDLYRQVKATAALRGVSVTSMIEDSLVLMLEQLSRGRERRAIPVLPVSANGGGFADEFLASGIDINRTSEVLDWLDRNP